MRAGRLACAVVLVASAAAVHAVPLQCAENKTTNGLFCFAPSQLKEAAGIRTAPLYAGGPNLIERTPYTIAANCSTGVMHLKDRRGVSFGGAGEGTPQSRELLRLV
ncbi:MAG TPA: hypothetical protein VN201_01575, partial [Roseateles sp.]|nr:hypothetical protein [Roseateles sp.]